MAYGITRGTSPRFATKLPKEFKKYNITVKKVLLVILQDDFPVITRKFDNPSLEWDQAFEKSYSGDEVGIKLSKEETMRLKAGVPAYVQLMLLLDTGEEVTTDIFEFIVEDRLVNYLL